MSYQTIKSLVFAFIWKTNGNVDYEELTADVMQHFPDSQWKKSHWAFYKNRIINGEYHQFFPKGIIDNLVQAKSGGRAKDPETKRIGDEILAQVRTMIDEAVGSDVDLRFRVNRWIFSRMQLEEVLVKRPIKQALWDSGIHACKSCGMAFGALKSVEIHRLDGRKAYTKENCILLCRPCHQKQGNHTRPSDPYADDESTNDAESSDDSGCS